MDLHQGTAIWQNQAFPKLFLKTRSIEPKSWKTNILAVSETSELLPK